MLSGWFDRDRSFDALEDFRHQMDSLLETYDRDVRVPARTSNWPRANLFDIGEGLALQVALPGVKKEDIQISSHQEMLTISGVRKSEIPEGYSLHRQERPAFQFCRSFAFPTRVDVEKADATFKDGLLTVKLPKMPELRPRSIAVKAG